LKRANDFPALHHIYNDPANDLRLIQGLIRTTDDGLSILSPFGTSIGVVRFERPDASIPNPFIRHYEFNISRRMLDV
jgi:hypothetical protein